MDNSIHKDVEVHTKSKILRIAVAGNPNSGKSTLINAIASSHLHVGNWPGVTIEKREAIFERAGQIFNFVDLPGTYSLSPYSQEEVIARDFLINEKPDLIINVVDATNLERNLYLTVQLLELGIPVLMALNIYDELETKKYTINITALEKMLGIKIVPTIATSKGGVDALLKLLGDIARSKVILEYKALHYGDEIETAIQKIQADLFALYPRLKDKYPTRWLAIKLFEMDDIIIDNSEITDPETILKDTCNHLMVAHNDDLEALLADQRYALANGLTKEVLSKPQVEKVGLTEKIDKIVLNRFLGIPIFLTAMWLVFKLTFDVANPFVDWVDATTVGPVSRWAATILNWLYAPEWMISLATEGIIAGVGFVLVFVPVIFGMMFFITFLEGSGYMARAAFVMDRAMHKIGLHGKSFIPLLLGFGCNVPAIYATRTLEHNRDKILTALLVPLMSCGARLPVYVLFTSIFFRSNAGLVLWFLYVLGIILAIGIGVIFKKTLFKGESPMFIMELPPYRMPTFQSLMIHTWEKGKHFLIKAGTYIFAVSIFVWFLLNIPWGVQDKQDSLLGQVGKATAPLFQPIGFGNWEAASSLITGIIAKEIVVGTMAEIYIDELPEEAGEAPTFSEDLITMSAGFVVAVKEAVSNVISTAGIASISSEEEEVQNSLKTVLINKFSPLGSLSFMVFVLLYMPCIVTAIAYRNEFGTWKWFGVAFIYNITLAWVISFIIYQGGILLGFGA